MGSFLARLPASHLEDSIDVGRASNFQLLGNRLLAECGSRVVGQPDHAHVFRMVGDAMEVERALELHVEAGRVLDRLPH